MKRVFEISRRITLTGFSGEELKQDIFITNKLEQPVHLTEFKWDLDDKDSRNLKDLLGAELEEIEDGRKYKFTVWNRKKVEPGRYLGQGMFITDFEGLKRKPVRIRVTVTPDVQVHPSTLFMGEMYIPKGVTKSFERNFRVISSRGDSLKVDRVVPSSNDMTINVKEVLEGRSFLCQVMLRPEPETGRYSSKLKVYTNYPGYEEIEVEVRGIVRVGLTPEK